MKYLVYTFVFVFLLFQILNLIFPLNINVSYSKFILDRNDKVVHAFLSEDEKWRMKTDIQEISSTLKKAIVHKEDKYFYSHFGINPFAICRAFTNNLIKGKRTSGASTITMQVARLLEPKARTYRNKIIEMFRAVQLETKYSKAEILQLYLNLVPYGGNIEGVKAASYLYFNKAPNHLSLAEITALSIIPNRPNSLKPGKDDAFLVKERNKWLNILKSENVFEEQIIVDALNEQFTGYRRNVPRFAPHFSRRILNEFTNELNIKTALNLEMQLSLEEIVKNYSNRLNALNIKNAAALIIDNNTNEIVSYIGSADFFNEEDAGQVDGIKAIRSPGSTLKPLIYATAFDKGIITQKLKISDLPVDFAGYTPSNYSDTYSGMVTVEDALKKSLNVPAVEVLNKIGIDEMLEKFELLNFQQIAKDEKKLGLSLALGGCGVSLFELTRMYNVFANKGKFTPLKFKINHQKNIEKTQIVSEAAAFVVTDILQKLERPDFPDFAGNISNTPKIAWKTGTSYGRKDAWSIGYNKNFTVGVWTGNFSALGVPELTGAEIATPLLFEIFNHIETNFEEWNFAPNDLKTTWVCSKTGKIPDHFCEDQILDWHLPLVSNHKKCKHQTIQYVNENETVSYCKFCLPSENFHTSTYQNLSPELISFYKNTNTPFKEIPPHNKNCERYFANEKLKIISPKANVDYYLLKNDNEEIELQSHIAADVNELYWYIDDDFYTAASNEESVFFKPKAGKNKITCVDDKGRKSSLTINVNYL